MSQQQQLFQVYCYNDDQILMYFIVMRGMLAKDGTLKLTCRYKFIVQSIQLKTPF